MTAYQIVLSEQAEREFKGLEFKIAQRITKKLELAKENPQYFFKRLVGSEYHTLRVGDYRVLAEISNEKRTIFLSSIRHRKNIYKTVEVS